MICRLADPAASDVRSVGGKAAALARLIAAHFPVPDGFVVTSPDEPGIASHIDPNLVVAVRSSGFSEDSAQASFAGQYETVLGVRGVSEVSAAISRCFDSFSNLRSAAYRENRGNSAQGGAVIVQRLVEADAAGVAFSIDPITGARDRIVIEANFGLGESVVGGHVNPDGFNVSKTTGEVVQRRISTKQFRSILAGNGSQLEPMPEDLKLRPSLSDEAIRTVADLAVRVESHYGSPVDIEWAWKDGEIWLLQSRPVTAAPAAGKAPLPPPDWVPELNTRIDPRFPLYSNGNVSEILPGCVSPLTYSLFSKGVERAFRDIAESVGSMPDVGPDPIVVGFFFHRIYLNASYFMIAADNSPGASRDTVYEDLIGPPPSRHPAWTPKDFLPWNLLRGARLITRYLALQGRLPKDIAECRAHYEGTVKLFDRRESEWGNEELAAWIAPDSKQALEPAMVHIRASQFATSSFGALRGMTKRWLQDSDGTLASMLVTGIGSIAGANPASALYAISRMVLAEPSMLALFEKEPDDQRLLLKLDGPLRDAITDFLNRFGHRGFREADFRSPCWREQPSAVLALIRKQLDPGSIDPQELAKRQAEVSEGARARAISRLSGMRRKAFLSVLESARKHIAAREEMKDLLLLFLSFTRRVITIAQKRLKDALETPDDIYFLLDKEVAMTLLGTLPATEIKQIVQRRRRDFEWSSTVFVSKLQDGVVKRYERREVDVVRGELTGIPVSPGQVEGRARVVLDPTSGTIYSGEILVAPVTDVAWTPMFLRAAAIVVEVGGPLSHGSIVAREYGIPAVTAVAHATTRIRTGARLRVDGEHGIVTIVSET